MKLHSDHQHTENTEASTMKRKKEQQHKPTIAPGIDDDEELNQKATPEEIKENETTEITTLSYDEVDPS